MSWTVWKIRQIVKRLKGVPMIKKPEAYLRLEKGLVDGYKIYGEIPLNMDVMLIGRFSRDSIHDGRICEIKVNDDYVSRGHANIFYDPEQNHFTIKERDGGTTNGTFINEEPINPDQPLQLQDGDLIQLAKIHGSYRVIFRFRESEGTLGGYLGRKDSPVPKRIEIDLRGRKVCVEGMEITLRKKEFDLLAYLFQNEGKVCSKDEIAQEVWKQEGGIVSQETIEQNVSRIRKAIEFNLVEHQYIKTIHGGYRLDLKNPGVS